MLCESPPPHESKTSQRSTMKLSIFSSILLSSGAFALPSNIAGNQFWVASPDFLVVAVIDQFFFKANASVNIAASNAAAPAAYGKVNLLGHQ